MNTRLRFWLQGNWPRNSSTHVFHGGAIDAIGKAMFDSEWKGSLDVGHQLEPAPGSSDWAHTLLAKHRPEFGRKPFQVTLQSVPELKTEEWGAAREVVTNLNKEKLAG